MLNVRGAVRQIKRKYRVRRSLRELEAREISYSNTTGKPHGLPHPLIVSLTSYPQRFGTLSFTLKSILYQTVQPDEVVLWVSDDDYTSIPMEVFALRSDIFHIRKCHNLKSYNKIVHSLPIYKDCFIATIDDDIYYWNNWLEELIDGYKLRNSGIICHRSHEIALNDDGLPGAYSTWRKNIRDGIPNPLIFPTGVLGVLYQPGVFHDDVCKESIFLDLCPTTDDVWLFWMWRMNNHCARKIGKKRYLIEWPGSQVTQLQKYNVGGNGNDRSIQNLIRRYGFPGAQQALSE